MDFFDPERVEALRGVQSALYGRNAIGGTINIISARPQFESTDGWFKARASSKEHYEAQLAQNIPVAENLAFRLGLDYLDQNKGFFYNSLQDKYFDSQHAEAVRGQVRFRTEKMDANLLAETSFAHLPELNFQLNIVPGTVAAFPRGVMQPQYDYRWNGNMVAKQAQQNLIFNINYDLGFADLSAVAAHRKRETQHGYDGDAIDPVFLAVLRAGGQGLTTDANISVLQADRTKSNYLELHLTDKGGHPLKWLVGAEHLTIYSFADFGSTRTPTTANPSIGSHAPSELDTVSDAVFGSIGYDLTERLNVTGEARYTRERKKLDGDRLDNLTGASLGARYNITTATSEEHNSYNVTGSYHLPWRRALAYVKYGTGFRASGFNTDLGDPRAPKPVPPAFDAENSTSVELGLKGELSRQVFVTLVAYQTNTDDVLIQDVNGCLPAFPACPVAGTGFLRNAGEARSRGYEVEVAGRFNVFGGNLRLTGAYSNLDAQIISGPDSGDLIPQVPDYTLTASLNYAHDLPGEVKGFMNLQYFKRSGGVQEAEQTPLLVDYDKLDLRMGVRRQGWEFALFSDNLTDRRYTVNNALTNRRWNVPRTFGAELTARW